MIEIKRWTDGKILYTAENAKDVRAAVEEAVNAGVSLNYAELNGAKLNYAELNYAKLNYAELNYAELNGAKLNYAKLNDAITSPSHPLWIFRQDYWSILDQAPAEVAGLRAALDEGRVNGSVYEGKCACLVGTIANVRGCSLGALDIPQMASRPAEQWFMSIREGDLPIALDTPKFTSEGVFRASRALVWIDEWVESRTAIAKVLAA